MKNADMPAMPIELDGNGQYAPVAYTGLTKREMIAAQCMAQLLPSLRSHPPRECAKLAIEFADALLKELEVSNDL